MKINKYILNIGLIGALLTAGSCKKQIFEDPTTSLSPDAAFSTADRIVKSATGMYDQLQNLNFFGGRVLIYTDIRGIDDGVPSYFGNMPQFNTVLASDATVAGAWQGAYRTIYEANNFMKNLAANPGKITQAQTDRFNSEAKFIRSLCYFYLVNLWAQPYNFTAGATHLGVPLVLTAASDPFSASNYLPRSTVAAVYSQMEADLKDAETKLPVDNGDASFADVSRATKAAAQALLMRIYLYKGDYTNANIYADKVINSGRGFALNTDPITAFRTYTTKESIFSVANNGADNPNTNNAIAQHYSPSLRADIPISPDYVNALEATDKRRTQLVITAASKPGTFWTAKYTTMGDWVPVFRYSEVLLTKAEALANLATGTIADPTAIALLNQVRTRSNASVVAPVTKALLISAIWNERRLELAFEGQGEFEFLRTGRDIPAHSTIPLQKYGSDYVILPIPKYDLDINTALVKNPGY